MAGGSRVVGKGRGAVYAGGRTYLEGATIPAEVTVGEHVFTDVEIPEGNVAFTPVRPIAAQSETTSETPAAANDGTIDDIRARIESGEVSAQAVLDAELAVTPKRKQRTSLIKELQAAVGAGTG